MPKVAAACRDCPIHANCSNFPLRLHAGIVGANGAGKSTLFRMLVGQEQPDSGQLKLGETVQTMYVDQSRDALQSERSVRHTCPVLAEAGWEYITSLACTGIHEWLVLTYVRKSGFLRGRVGSGVLAAVSQFCVCFKVLGVEGEVLAVKLLHAFLWANVLLCCHKCMLLYCCTCRHTWLIRSYHYILI